VSIRFKVILPYLLLTIIVAVTGAYVVLRLVTSSLEERLSNHLLEAGRVVSNEMIRQEREHAEKGVLIAHIAGFSESLQAGDKERVSELAGPAAGGQYLESLMVFDAQGLQVSHFIEQSNGTLMDVSQPGRSSDFPFVTDLLRENNPDSLPRRGLAVDPVDGRQYYYTALPVEFEGQLAGIVVVGSSLNVILPDLKNTSLADVIFYGEDRQVIASTIGMTEEGLFQRTISIPDELYQAVLTSEGVVNGENINVGERRYSIAYGPLQIGNDSLAVYAVVLPLDFVVTSSENSRDWYVWVYSLATVAVVLLGYLIARLIVNPLAKLVRVSLAITSGDLTRRTEIRSRDEIGILANTFDTMTDSLQQRTLELEKSNKLLEQMDRTKTRFIQVAAHELRTPLTIVQGYAQMIEARGNEGDQLTRYAGGIMEGTSRMVEIIDNMLDVSRIDTNQLGVMPVSIEVDQVAVLGTLAACRAWPIVARESPF
jgi:signal transduction histidine kinase